MIINGSSTKLFAGVGLAVLAVPRLGNVRLRLHFLRRGTSGGQPKTQYKNSNNNYVFEVTFTPQDREYVLVVQAPKNGVTLKNNHILGIKIEQVVFEGESVDYRYGFNTQQKQDDIYGPGNHTTALYWEYDTRLGRRWNLDPVVFPYISRYATLDNNPILKNDVKGDCPTCIAGGIIGGLTEYGLQVAMNIADGQENPFTDNIDVAAIGFATLEGAATQGASAIKSVGVKVVTKLAIKTVKAIADNSYSLTTQKGGKLKSDRTKLFPAAQGAGIDLIVDAGLSFVLPGGGRVTRTAKKILDKRNGLPNAVASVAKKAYKATGGKVTSSVNNTIKKASKSVSSKIVGAPERLAQEVVKEAVSDKQDEVKKKVTALH